MQLMEVSRNTKQDLYPKRFVIHNEKSHVCKLKKALYGLKQAPRAWYVKIDELLISLGFSKNVLDSNLYYHIVGSECLILVLYVDDLFLTNSERLVIEIQASIDLCFRDEGSGYDAQLLETRSMAEN
jgi:hypothetical protein